MKKILLTIIGIFGLGAAISGFTYFESDFKSDEIIVGPFCEGWAEGWAEGTCEGYTEKYGGLCPPTPVTPVCPVAPVGRNTWKGGYNMGYKAGYTYRMKR